MALKQKSIQGKGIVQLRSASSSQDGSVLTLVETFTGPYSELKTKQQALLLQVKGTALTPTTAGQGQLVVTKEEEIVGEPKVKKIVTIEVVWQELRRAVEHHPIFKDLTTEQVKDARNKAAADGPATAPNNELASKLYDFFVKGTTEYSTGVPLVRRTTTNVRGDLDGGGAWTRGDPPISVDGTWEWMKTADERRRVGRSYTQTEEWTGAKEWDEDLYPAA